MSENNLNDEVEAFKSLAYAMKDAGFNQNIGNKILRALRSHEKRLVRLEKQMNINPSPKELAD